LDNTQKKYSTFDRELLTAFLAVTLSFPIGGAVQRLQS
jgi:hypothetical protein